MNIIILRLLVILVLAIILLQVLYEIVGFFDRKRFLTPEEYNGYAENVESGLFDYWVYARLNPTFSIPAMDIDVYKETVAVLENSLKLFSEFYEGEDYADIRSSFFPTAFLRTLPDLEYKRRSFIEYPSDDNALQYHQGLILSMNAYRSELLKLITIINKLEDKKIAFINGYTSPSYVSDVLIKLNAEISRLSQQENKRFSCISNRIFTCQNLREVFESGREIFNLSDTSMYSVPNNIKTNAELFKKYFLSNPNTEASQPLIVEEKSFCYNHTQPVISRLWWPRDYNELNLKTMRTTVVNDMLLQETGKLDSPYHKAHYEQGIIYDIQDTSPYFCIDYGKQFGQVTSSYYVYEFLRSRKIFENMIDLSPELVEQSVLEREIRNSTTSLHVSIVADYFKGVELWLQKHGEKELVNIIGLEKYHNLMHLRLIQLSQSAYPEVELNTLTYLTVKLRDGVLIRAKMLMDSLFITQASLSTTYQLANQTFVGRLSGARLLEVETPVPLNGFGILSWNDDLSKEISLDEFVEYLEEFNRLVVEFKIEQARLYNIPKPTEKTTDSVKNQP